MTSRHLIPAAVIAVAAYGFITWSPPQARTAAAEEAKVRRRGVSMSGAEFGTEKLGFSNANPGAFNRDYGYSSPKSYQHFADRGINLFRIPVRWERLQPRPGEDLDRAELGRLRNAVGRARKHGGEAVIDVHNYGRYVIEWNGLPLECVIDQPVAGTVPVSRAHFADLWRRLSQAFRGESAVHAYGLMNEPHDMGGSDWKGISQAAVDAIRAEGDRKLILVAGNDWSRADRFAEANGKAWINDPTGNVAYEAHCYFDRDASGRYAKGFDAELASDPGLEERGVRRLLPFVEWCRANGVRGFVGEFGVPGNDPRWMPLLARFVDTLDEFNLDGCCWGGGDWWDADYALSLQPHPVRKTAAPQLASLNR